MAPAAMAVRHSEHARIRHAAQRAAPWPKLACGGRAVGKLRGRRGRTTGADAAARQLCTDQLARREHADVRARRFVTELPVVAFSSVTEPLPALATQTRAPPAAMAAGLLNWYLGPVKTRIGAPVAAFSSVTEPGPGGSLVTQMRPPSAAMAAG
jgi:hypothetical protein